MQIDWMTIHGRFEVYDDLVMGLALALIINEAKYKCEWELEALNVEGFRVHKLICVMSFLEKRVDMWDGVHIGKKTKKVDVIELILEFINVEKSTRTLVDICCDLSFVGHSCSSILTTLPSAPFIRPKVMLKTSHLVLVSRNEGHVFISH